MRTKERIAVTAARRKLLLLALFVALVALFAPLAGYRTASAEEGAEPEGRIIGRVELVPGVPSRDCKEVLLEGFPLGSKCDKEGNVYCTGPGGIFAHDSSGTVLARIRTPGHHPTNFAWGDDDWRSLYITNIGSVVRTRLNIPGVPSR